MNQKRIKEKLVLKTKVKIWISKVLVCIIFFLIGMILVKQTPSLKKEINQKLYEDHIAFTKLRNHYEKYFGKILSLEKVQKKEQPVFQETLSYEKKEKYKEGVKLTVSDQYMVPALESGVVVFLGDKKDYGKTIIIEQIDGIDTFYSNISIDQFKLYDYVEKGELVGHTTNNILYLVFQKEGKSLDYQKYI